MKVQELLEAKEIVPIDKLTAIAASREAFGEDVEIAFRTQAELRQRAASAILDNAKGEGELLASDQRAFDRQARERDGVISLLRQVEQRTGAAYRVPESQAVATRTEPQEQRVVVARDEKVADWLHQRGGYQYAGEKGAESMRLGAIVRGMIGVRNGLTALEQRALSEGSDSAGGYSVPDVLAARFIDRVGNRMAVRQAGAVLVPMTSDILNIARVASEGMLDTNSPPTSPADWKTENSDITEGTITLERVQFTARTLPVLVKLSVELSEDSANIDQIIESELAKVLALELDRAALLGSGSAPQPRGIRNQVGVNVEAHGGTTPTSYDFLVNSIGRVWASNHEPNARIYNSSIATMLAKLKEGGSSLQPLRAPDVVTALPAFRTNQIPDDGISPDTSTMFVGDFTNLMIGMRTGFRIEATRVAGEAFGKLQIWVRAYLRADVQLARPEAFDVVTGIGIG